MKIRYWVIGCVIALGVLLASTYSPQPGQANASGETVALEQIRQDSSDMQEAFAAMGPMFTTMLESMLNGTLDVMAKPETSDRLATFIRNYYDALIAKGFTRHEAMRIVTTTTIPTVPTLGS